MICSEMGIERGREMGIEREKQIRKKKGRERERERESILYVKAVEKNNKKFEKKEYFIEISCKIDKLMWVFCKNECVK